MYGSHKCHNYPLSIHVMYLPIYLSMYLFTLATGFQRISIEATGATTILRLKEILSIYPCYISTYLSIYVPLYTGYTALKNPYRSHKFHNNPLAQTDTIYIYPCYISIYLSFHLSIQCTSLHWLHGFKESL